MSQENYKGLRVRTGALIVRDRALLLVKLQSPARRIPVWMPPGGKVETGETLDLALKREVFEETGLEVDPGRISLIHEFIEPPYHAIEFYHVCRITGGNLLLGRDPEVPEEDQILLDLKFIPFPELEDTELHPAILRKNAGTLTHPAGKVIHVRTV